MIDVDSHCSFLRFVYLFLAVLGLCLCCCVRASSSCGEWGLLFVELRRLLFFQTLGTQA